MKKRISKEQLRSFRWYGKDDLRSFGHRSRTKQMGLWDEEYIGKPIIGIINPWNELNTCHTHFPDRVIDIKRGVTASGGFPVEIPVMSLGEQLMKPTAMLFRNFLAMEVEEIIRAYPIDGVVLLGGCDKTTPGVIMGGISVGLPMLYVPGGAMRKAAWRGEVLGSGSDVWKYWEEKRIGTLPAADWEDLENSIAATPGTCMSMGTAATMMSVADALGLCITGASSIPAVDANHRRMGSQSGRLIVEMVWQDVRPTDIISRQSVENAVKVCCAIGGSTNAIIHIVAIAKRAKIPFSLEEFDTLAKDVPLLANIKPTGKYVMEDFYFAGGLKALMWQLRRHLNLQLPTVNFRTLHQNVAESKVWNETVITSVDNSLSPGGSLVILKGNIAPNGCVLKPHAMEKRFLKHTGKALVYDHIKTMKIAMEDMALDVSKDDVLVLRNAGSVGAMGMPEWGQLPLPKKLVKQGVRDMLRISDARMSGTSYGACILHVSPEAALHGPLALIQNGDEICLDVEKRSLHVLVDEVTLAARRKKLPPITSYDSGYAALFSKHIQQADQGCDFDFLAHGDRTSDEPFID